MSTSQKQVFTTTNPFEARFGYHRAVRRGPFIFVAGTTALKLGVPIATEHGQDAPKAEIPDSGVTPREDCMILCPDDAYGQTLISLRRGIDAVKALGGSLGDIMRIRLYVPRPEDCSAVCQAFKDIFGTERAHLEGIEGQSVSFRAQEYIDEGRHTGIVRSLPLDEPAVVAAMVIVPNGFVDPNIRVEIELDAIVL